MRYEWCDICREPLGQVTLRRWHPPGGVWHRVEQDGTRFFRRSRSRGREWRAGIEASRGYDWIPGRDEVGLPVEGVVVECPKCSTPKRIMR